MKKIVTVLVVIAMVSLSSAFILGAAEVLPLFKIENVYAQTIDNTLAQKQRLGTNNIFSPQGVHILFSNGQNATLDQQFIVLGSYSGPDTQNSSLVVKNPDYGLSDTNSTLSVGQNFTIDSTTEEGIKYTAANVRLVPIASLPPGTKLSDIDPETDLIQQTPLLSVGTYQGNASSFTIPQVVRPGNYLIDVHLHYPSLGITTAYSGLVRIVNSGVVPGGAIPR
jgi:hypothetical protein